MPLYRIVGASGSLARQQARIDDDRHSPRLVTIKRVSVPSGPASTRAMMRSTSSSKPSSRSTCRRAPPIRRSLPHSSAACRVWSPEKTGLMPPNSPVPRQPPAPTRSPPRKPAAKGLGRHAYILRLQSLKAAAPNTFTSGSTASAARPRTTSRRGRTTSPPTAPPAMRPRLTSFACSCALAPIGSCGRCAAACLNVRLGELCSLILCGCAWSKLLPVSQSECSFIHI
jgi:hypothetical protein